MIARGFIPLNKKDLL